MAEADAFRAHNSYRRSVGKAPLRSAFKLRTAAQSHAKYMAQTHQMSHSENVNGRRTVGERARQAGFNWSVVGENVAAGQTTAGQVMNGWMDSPGHRENILNGNYKYIGIGLARDSKGVNYWCAVFGK